MNQIRYNAKISDSTQWQADATVGFVIFEYKPQVRDLRMLQSSMMMLAQLINEHPEQQAVLIINETRISTSRLETEWQSYQKLFNPKIVERLCIAVFSDDELERVFGKMNQQAEDVLKEVQAKLSAKHTTKRRSPDSFLDVFRVLLVQWFRHAGPLQINQLTTLTGFSYPTVASALEKMETHLLRHSNRSIELKQFPREIWMKLLADCDTLRMPLKLSARKPRPLEMLLERLQEQPIKEVGRGGIVGARYYLPEIDLVGTPRLDLTIRDTSDTKIEKLIRCLDPALKPAQPGQAPQVVIHRLFRPRTFFNDVPTGFVADEVECILDLHEARLESQAKELLEHFKRKAI